MGDSLLDNVLRLADVVVIPMLGVIAILVDRRIKRIETETKELAKQVTEAIKTLVTAGQCTERHTTLAREIKLMLDPLADRVGRALNGGRFDGIYERLNHLEVRAGVLEERQRKDGGP